MSQPKPTMQPPVRSGSSGHATHPILSAIHIALSFRLLARLVLSASLCTSAFALVLIPLACKKSEPAADAAQKAAPAATPEPPRGTSGATFDPALLEDRSVSSDFLVALPPAEGQTLRVTLMGKPPSTLALRVAVECAGQESFDELTKRAEILVRVLTESAQTRDVEFARTAEGRLAIKEDIATRLQASMEHKGIKQVHYLEYRIENVR